jgi:hypothetical protein
MNHTLRLECRSAAIVASCECGKWSRILPIMPGERPADLHAQLELAHKIHVERVTNTAQGNGPSDAR